MAYKTKDLEKQAIKAARENNLHFIEDVVALMPCTKPTFYEHKINESNELKSILTNNKIAEKQKLRKKWSESDNATLQMALYKLLANDEERKKLSIQYQQVDHSGSTEIKVTIDDAIKEWL
jgi:hypothetical protein